MHRPELAASVLACQSWVLAARATLYRRIYFRTVGARAAKLETTLSSSPHICALIRHLWVMHTEECRNHLLSWVSLIPANSLLSLHLVKMPVSTGPTPLLQFPAIRTVPHITIARSSFLQAQPSNLAVILSFPLLKSLSFLVNTLPLRLEGPLRLQRLSIGVMEDGRPQLLAVILNAIVPHSLRKLDLYLSSLEEDHVAWLTDLLQPHLPELRHLAIRTLDRTRTAVFVDNIIGLMPHLESLACGRRTYTSQLLSTVPHSLRSLTLESDDNEPFPREELEESVERLCNTSHRRFSSLTIGRHPSYPNSLYFERVSRVCQSFGVSFTINRGSISEHLELGLGGAFSRV
ncbi:hypothetical protein PHLGIDRAFT_205279 [Phlebiopsis gigantea 11061_1 CR5-6]|uniref:F-box domain-containing protein n=1 Tax=Phlebiopsis gigantea (strain 11061_1 CR5-6) TaxID=745531 RepID=A0A0C3PF69_PHLG1|nr:hypothetical protein PHLGIDRAFT_205279 [Phlebiopsis gigantea 11061_1 CR5-6]